MPRDTSTITTSPNPVTPSDGRPRLGANGTDKPLPGEPPKPRIPFQRSPLPQEYQAAVTAPPAAPIPRPVRRHNSSVSVDSVRGRWEERAKEAGAGPDTSVRIPRSQSPKKWSSSNNSLVEVPLNASPERHTALRAPPEFASGEPTPTYLKRRTLPTTTTPSSIRDQWEQKSRTDDFGVTGNTQSAGQLPERSAIFSSNSSESASERNPTSPLVYKRRTMPSFEDMTSSPTKSSSYFNHEPATLSSPRVNSTASLKSSSIPDVKELGEFAVFSTSPSRSEATREGFGTARGGRSNSFDSKDAPPYSSAALNASAYGGAMQQSPHRSSYMRKTEQFGTLGNRRLGNHLPRIASGDGEVEVELSTRKREIKYAPSPSPQISPTRSVRGNISVDSRYPASPKTESPLDSPLHGDFVVPTVTNAETVAGRPDRKRLSRQDPVSSAPSSPLPSSRLTRGLWADVQRHLLHAYEYLCHVGEAQQWIEGCLDEELGFGVVEMEEGLRNGVVLAKLVRVWEGDAVVRKIFEVF